MESWGVKAGKDPILQTNRDPEGNDLLKVIEQVNERAESKPRSPDTHGLNSTSMSSYSLASCLCMDLGGRWRGGLSDPKDQSVAGFSQNGTGAATLPPGRPGSEAGWGPTLADQASWASSQSGTIGTARSPLTSYIIK